MALLGAELAGDLIAVDVVDLAAELLEVLVDEGLQRADGQLDLRVGDSDEIVVAVQQTSMTWPSPLPSWALG